MSESTAIPVSAATADEHRREGRRWDGKTRSGFGIYLFFFAFKWLGPRVAYLMLYPVVFYYRLFARKGVRASREYLRRRFPGLRGLKLWLTSYRHFLSFGRILIDRVYAFLGLLGRVEFSHDGDNVIPETLKLGKGLILMSAHVGNWELAAYCLKRLDPDYISVPVNAVMFKADGEKVQKWLQRVAGEPPFRVIASNDSLQASIEMVAALKRGEVVAIHGDRILGSGGVKVPFLGAEASFPAGPFLVAANTGTPVVFTFANREGNRRYALMASGPHYFRFTSRKNRDQELKQWVRQYAELIEQRLERYPLQWHNFYPFWNTESGTGW